MERELELVDYFEKITTVDRKMKIIDITDDFISSMNFCDLQKLEELKKLKWSLQYSIK